MNETVAALLAKARTNAPPPEPPRYTRARKQTRGFAPAPPRLDPELAALSREAARARIGKTQAETAQREAETSALLKLATEGVHVEIPAQPVEKLAPAPVIHVHVPPPGATRTRVVERTAQGLVVESLTTPVEDA